MNKTTKFVPFEEWMPDRANLATGAILVQNVLPTADGYEVAPGFVKSPLYDTPPAPPLLIRSFRLPSGDLSTLMFCAQNIYRLVGSSWVSVTRISGPYNTAAGANWSVAQWGDIVYATNYADKIQKFVLTGGVNFEDVDMKTGGFRCRHLIIIRDYLVGLDVNDDTGTNPNPYGMSWSGRLRPEDMEPSLATGANYRDIVDIGNIVGAVGGDYGVVLGQSGMVTLDYIGHPLTWQISKKEEDIGCLLANSIIKVAGVVYWYSQKGWRASAGGNASQPIGTTRVDTYCRTKMDIMNGYRMSAIALSSKPIVVWSYVSADSVDKKPDRLLYFNTVLNKFTEGVFEIEALGTAGPADQFVDDSVMGELLVDEIDGFVDDTGDHQQAVIAVDRDGDIVSMTPLADMALIETKEVEFAKGKRTRVLGVRLVAEGASEDYRARVSARDRQPTSNINLDPWIVPERTGRCAADRRGRYHRFAFELRGNFTNILGADITFVDAGEK